MTFLALLVGLSFGATHTVATSGADYTTLSAAIAAASDGDRIEVGPGLYSECLDLDGKDLEIVGSGAGWTGLQGDGTCESVIVIDDGEDAAISDLTFLNPAGRAIELTHAALRLDDVTFVDLGVDDAAFEGGVVRVEGGELQVEGCTFQRTMGGLGSAVYAVDGAIVEVQSSTLEDGLAASGALYLADGLDGVDPSALVLEDSTLSGHWGGALYAGAGAEVESLGNLWTDNVDEGPDYVTVHVAAGATYASTDDVYAGNQDSNYKDDDATGGSGGAIQGAGGATVRVSGGTFTDNAANSGGAIYLTGDGSTLVVTDSTFEDNQAYENGGAINVVDGGTSSATSVSVSGSTFEDNDTGHSEPLKSDIDTSVGSGGALALTATTTGGVVSLVDSTFRSNTADSNGGAISLSGWGTVGTEGLVLENNATFHKQDDGKGGAIYATSLGSVTARDLWVEGNRSDEGAGLYFVKSTSAALVDVTFLDQDVGYNGGALYMSVESGSIQGGSFWDNSAEKGSVLYATTPSGKTSTWTISNSVFVENGGEYTEQGTLVFSGIATATLSQVDLIGNEADAGSAIYASKSGIQLINTIVAYNTGAAVYATGTGASGSFSYDDWYMNGSNVGGVLSLDTTTGGHQTVDPGYTALSLDGDLTNDDLSLAAGSSLIDAGDPGRLDTDGSTSDIGAYGGTGASVWIEDDTGDTGEPPDTGGGGTDDTADPGDSGDPGESGDSGDTGEACGPATDGVITVGVDGDCPTLTGAVAAAVDGDTLRVQTGLYEECVDLGGKDLTIEGESGSAYTYLRAPSGCERALVIDAGVSVTVRGLTVLNLYGGAISVVDATARFEDLVVAHSGLTEETRGTALYVESSEVEIADSTFHHNRGYFGAAIYAEGMVDLTIEATAFERNNAYAGGATVFIYPVSADTPATVHISDSTFLENDGGDIQGHKYVTLETSGCTFQGTTDYRAINLNSYGALTSTDDLYSRTAGGIAVATGGTVQVTRGVFYDTDAPDQEGAGIRMSSGGSLTVTGSSFEGIQGMGWGGAISTDSTYEITDSTFTDNSLLAYDEGDDSDPVESCGAIYASEEGIIADCTFEGNTDGEICADDALVLTGSTFTDASALTVKDLEAEDLVFRDSATTTALTAVGAIVSLTDIVMRNGGGLSVTSTAALDVRGLVVSQVDETRSYRALTSYSSTGTATIEDSWFCNVDGGAIYLYGYGTGSATVTNNVFVENSAKTGGAIQTYGVDVDVTNNTFVGNAGTTEGGGAYIRSSTGEWKNNIIAWTQQNDGVYGYDGTSGRGMYFLYNDWYSNTDVHRSGYFSFPTTASGNVEVDPGFVAYSLDGDCTNDSLWLDTGSALIDAGDPSVLDDDGSRSDMGAWSGTEAPSVDWDGDRYDMSEDCDESDPDIHPGAEELCGGGDEDCDGETDEDGAAGGQSGYTDADGDGLGDPDAPVSACTLPSGVVLVAGDCDDGDPAVGDSLRWYLDADGDGYGDAGVLVEVCDAPAGYVSALGDCDDGAATVNPGAAEVCDALDVDEDCDGLADDLDLGAADPSPWYADADGDGYGDAGVLVEACDAPAGYVSALGDCDDSAADIHPEAVEVCDALDVDEDCDGLADDLDVGAADPSTWYTDADGDGYGDAALPLEACDLPLGYAEVAGDCDDARADVSPAGTEACDASDVDEDCDSLADDADSGAVGPGTWYTDGDGDGHGDPSLSTLACDAPSGMVGAGDDCDDSNTDIYPGADEPDCTDPVDYNCDGSVGYRDADADGHAACAECDDSQASVHPGATEDIADGVDQDCDGQELCLQDGDDDGYLPDAPEELASDDLDCADAMEADLDTPAGDCDDTDPAIAPDATDLPGDGVDQDCDGADAEADSQPDTDPPVDTGLPDDSGLDSTPTPGGDSGGGSGADTGDGGEPGCAGESGCAGGGKAAMGWIAPGLILLVAGRRARSRRAG